MNHQSGKVKLNRAAPHRRTLLRNQLITLIQYGHLVSTKARVKEVRRFAEKMVTLARRGNTFIYRNRAQSMLPYNDEALAKLFTEIAPRYTHRPGGYTRIIPLGRRVSDTATMAKLEWVI
jgi:large subunit ribosomal protein L17